MNKLAIPIILVAVIMVAGVFAFSPVDTATTVHGTISDDYDALKDTMCNTSDDVDFDPNTGTCVGFDD